ncbi:YraN family protein [Candidatus Gottesmanbacteria bacterium]|nr:YraN family protein [Candidatus Gottesmanbacteria bacterium]
MKKFNRQTGLLAEKFAADALKEKGYQILAQNFSNRYGEIDIIAKDKNVLVFVEVKAKIGTDFGIPEEMINPSKLQRIRNMGLIYMKDKSLPCRIDVVAVILSESNTLIRLTHYENVY